MPGPYNFRRFKCDACGRSDFKTQRGLKYHLNKRHPVFDDTASSSETSDSSNPYDTSPDDSNRSTTGSNHSLASDHGNDLGGAGSPQDANGAERINGHHDGSFCFYSARFSCSYRPLASPAPNPPNRQVHPLLDGGFSSFHYCYSTFSADTVDEGSETTADGLTDLPPGSPPPPFDKRPFDWTPFDNHIQFELAGFLYQHVQMSQTKIDELLELIAGLLLLATDGDTTKTPPYSNHKELYEIIDSIKAGDAPWMCFTIKYNGPRPAAGHVPAWMDEEYEVWTRDTRTLAHIQLGNPDFANNFHKAPFRDFTGPNGSRVYCDLMSGEWAWEQCVSDYCLL